MVTIFHSLYCFQSVKLAYSTGSCRKEIPMPITSAWSTQGVSLVHLTTPVIIIFWNGLVQLLINKPTSAVCHTLKLSACLFCVFVLFWGSVAQGHSSDLPLYHR